MWLHATTYLDLPLTTALAAPANLAVINHDDDSSAESRKFPELKLGPQERIATGDPYVSISPGEAAQDEGSLFYVSLVWIAVSGFRMRLAVVASKRLDQVGLQISYWLISVCAIPLMIIPMLISATVRTIPKYTSQS